MIGPGRAHSTYYRILKDGYPFLLLSIMEAPLIFVSDGNKLVVDGF
jgi:hypothetical protein